MTPNPAYWAAQCAAFSDGHLLRFVTACENSRKRYEAALAAAMAEARRRNLVQLGSTRKRPGNDAGPV